MSPWPPPHLWGKKSHLKLNVIQSPCNGENWGKECLNTVWNGCYEYRLCVLCMRLLLFRDLQGCIRDFHQIIYIWDFIPFAFLYLPSNDVLYVFLYAYLVNCVISPLHLYPDDSAQTVDLAVQTAQCDPYPFMWPISWQNRKIGQGKYRATVIRGEWTQ